MDYALEIQGAPQTVPAGTSILLEHPSIGGTDPIDTGFLSAGSEPALVVSTRTTAREVAEKLDHYGVDPEQIHILDAVSIDRGYSRRDKPRVEFVPSPDDVDGIVNEVKLFFESVDGESRLSFDSISELAYYAGESAAVDGLDRLTELLRKHRAIGLFHVSPEVHDSAIQEQFEAACDGLISLDESGSISTNFDL
jgi:KaiC/GvpD/RAD55 family RecA-like ATPase